MIDIPSLMDRTEQLARDCGIALFPNNPRTYCRLNEENGEVEWVVGENAPIGVKTTPSVMSREAAQQALEMISQGLTY